MIHPKVLYERFLNKAREKYELGSFQEGIDLATESIKVNSRDERGYSIRAYCKYAISDFKGSVNDLSKALGIEPDGAENLVIRSELFKLLGDRKASEIDLTNAAEIYKKRGIKAKRYGDFNKSLKNFEKAMELNPGIRRQIQAMDKLYKEIEAEDKLKEAFDLESTKEKLERKVFQSLSPRERDVINLRFGLEGEGPLTLCAIENRLGLTTNEIMKIEDIALLKLRNAFGSPPKD